MMKKLNIATILMVLVLVLSTMAAPATVKASDSNKPYGYTYDDAATNKTVYKFYGFSETKKVYVLSKEFYSKGTYLYRSDGTLITNQLAGSGSKFNGFAENSYFYSITKTGGLTQIDTQNRPTEILESGAIRLNYNSDDIAYTVTTTSGTFYLKNLKPAPEKDDDDEYNQSPTVKKSPNRVDIYTNSANETVYEGYKNGKLKVKLIVSSNGSRVLNATARVRLTDTLQGAKFLGMDHSYNVYLYEKNSLYRFKQGNWYNASRLALSGNYKSFKKDDNGFISKIVTSKSSYTMKQLTTASKWKAKKTYVVSKSGYKTLYRKGSTSSYTLSLKSGILKLNGKKVASGVSKYGFINGKTFVYSKKGTGFSATLKNPKKTKKVCTGVKNFKINSVGITTKIVTTKGTRKF